MTATELAAALGLNVDQVYRLAYRLHWRRSNTRPARYVVSDVRKSMAEDDDIA